MAVYLNESRAVVGKLTRMANVFDAHNGRIETCDLWSEVDGQLSNPAETRENFRHMEQFLRLLKSLPSSYEAHILDARTKACVPPLTLADLPDEIIIQILEHLEFDIYSLIKYSHVCTRLRNVILGTPTLWARITLDKKFPVPLINAIARRSGALGLTVKFDFRDALDWEPGALLRVFEMCKYRHRWISSSSFVGPYAARELQRRFPTGELSLLQTFSNGDIDEFSGYTLFYRKWSFPALTKCDLRLKELDVSDIIALLTSAHKLTHLDLCVTNLTNRERGGQQIHEVTLPLLGHLKIKTALLDRGVLGDLLDAIHCPSLNCLTLDLLSLFWDLEYILKGIQRRYPSLANFRLLLDTTAPRAIDVFFEDVLRALPGTIESVGINACRALRFHTSRTSDVSHPNPNAAYPNLKELELALEYKPPNDFAANLSALLTRSSVKLHHFRLGSDLYAKATLRRAGVLVNLPAVDASAGLTPLPCGCRTS